MLDEEGASRWGRWYFVSWCYVCRDEGFIVDVETFGEVAYMLSERGSILSGSSMHTLRVVIGCVGGYIRAKERAVILHEAVSPRMM